MISQTVMKTTRYEIPFINPRISSQGFHLGHAKSLMHAIRMFAIEKKVNSGVHASVDALKRPRQDEKNWVGTKVNNLREVPVK